MTSYRLSITAPLTGDVLDARIYIDHGTNVVIASALVFDSDSFVVLDTEPERYIGFCDTEVIYQALDRLPAYHGVEYADISAALDDAGLSCECDD